MVINYDEKRGVFSIELFNPRTNERISTGIIAQRVLNNKEYNLKVTYSIQLAGLLLEDFKSLGLEQKFVLSEVLEARKRQCLQNSILAEEKRYILGIMNKLDPKGKNKNLVNRLDAYLVTLDSITTQIEKVLDSEKEYALKSLGWSR